MFWALFIVVKLICLHSNASGEKTLQFVHALWRHGNRTPLNVYTNDSCWSEGLGQLTTKGIQQQYELGRYLKMRYKNFLSETYNSDELCVRSIDQDRMIMSAKANLAGMYPTLGKQIWNDNLIPVHTLPVDHDSTLSMHAPCFMAKELRTEIMQAEEIAKLNIENEEFFQFLANKTGIASVKIFNIGKILDPLTCEYCDERKWPDWADENVYKKLISLARFLSTYFFPTPEMRRLRGGLLFHEIAERMKNSSLDETNKLKYYAYSVSDLTLIALLSNLGAYDGAWPLFSNVVLIELYKQDDQFIVEIYKRNGTAASDVYNIALNNCNPCTVDKFLSLAEKNRPSDWWSECQQKATAFGGVSQIKLDDEAKQNKAKE